MASNFPNTLDSDITLYQVADGLRVKLIEDYNVGDTIITVLGDETTMRLFSDTGIITLTDQCAEPEQRAISFSYTLRTLTTFEGLTLLSGFVDNAKPKNLTSVTQNVMAQHHNNLKDAGIDIEKFDDIVSNVYKIVDKISGFTERNKHSINNLCLLDTRTNSQLNNSLIDIEEQVISSEPFSRVRKSMERKRKNK